MQVEEIKAHSHLSASSAERWFNCPGSVALSKQMPPQPSSSFAAEGTLAHSWLEYKLRVSLFGKGEKPEEEMSDDMEEAVDIALDYIIDKFMLADEDNILIEHRFDLSYIFKGMFGTADFCGLTPDGKLYVIDYKHGRGVVVNIEDNKQLHYYAVGAVNHFDVSANTDVCMAIIQPRAMGQNIKEQWKKAGEVHEWTNELIEAAKLADSENAPLKEGSHCKWCPALPRCPLVADKFFTEVAKIEANELSVKEFPKPEFLTKEELINIIDKKELIESWLDSCYGYLNQAAKNGEEIPGYKLVKKKSYRKWVDEAQVIKEFEYLGEAIYAEPKLKSPAQLEKMKVIDKAVLADLIYTPDSDTTLVPDVDKREAVAGVSVDQIFFNTLNNL
jgi:hypothetical protein